MTMHKNFYFTYGVGSPCARGFTKISAEDSGAARDIMFKEHGRQWAFQYGEEEFLPQIAEYDLYQIDEFWQPEQTAQEA